jgi:hypothetical protein
MSPVIDSPEEPGSSSPARGEDLPSRPAEPQPSPFEGSAPADDPPGSGPPPAVSRPLVEPEPWPPAAGAEPVAAEAGPVAAEAEPPAAGAEPWPAAAGTEPVAAEAEPWPAAAEAEPVAAGAEPWPAAAGAEPWPVAAEAEPAAAGAEPWPAAAGTEPVAAEAEPPAAGAEPWPAAAGTEPVAAEAEPPAAGAEPWPAAAGTEPPAAEAEPWPPAAEAEPWPPPAEAGPLAAEAGPLAAEAEPVAAEAGPVAAEAEPVAAGAEPWPPSAGPPALSEEPPLPPAAAEAEPAAAEAEPAAAEAVAPEPAPLPIAVEEPPLPPAEPAAEAEPAAAAIPVGAAAAVGAASARKEAAETAPEASKPGITIGSLAKPRGGPKALITRIGLILVGLLILATIVVGGITVISKLHNKSTNVTTGASPTPTSATPGIVYFKYSDPKNQFSIDRPADWTARTLDQPDPHVVLLIGPPTSAYSVEDFVSVQIHPLPMRLGAGDLVPFKESIQQGLQNQGDNIIDFSPTPVIDGMVGWYFLYTYPGTNPPTGLHSSYYLIDGDREILLTLQVQPYNDNVGFTALYPIFQHMAQSLVSFYTLPSPAASTAPTPTVSPSG